MKYGAGSALPSEAMARSNSCCMVRKRIGSAAPAAPSCPCRAETAKRHKTRARNKDFKNDIVIDECTSSIRHRKCYVRLFSEVSSEARDPYSQEVYRVGKHTSVS